MKDRSEISDSARQPLTYRAVLSIAIPVMVSNVSTPLIGIVDTGIVGQIPDPAYIGAVAVGSLIFSFVFWAFGFLRMGTTGLTAQAFGARDTDEMLACLVRALMISAIAGTSIVLLQWPIGQIAFALLGASAEVEGLSREYFDIRVWAAPATLANYALLGWFVGLGRTDIGLALQLLLNISNILLDALFVLGFGWDVRGVALGTVIAECIAATSGMLIAWRHLRSLGGQWSVASVFDVERLKRTFAVNTDIMFRSLALVFVYVWFMANGAEQGDVVLAANAVLMHFISVGAFFLDGLAFSAEAIVGRAIGALNRDRFRAAAGITTQLAAAVAVVVSLLFFLFGVSIIELLTADSAARSAAREYLPWAAAAPMLGVWAFQLDGIFIGATRTADMRNAMLMSLAIYLVAWWVLTPFGNHGLWAAFYVHYIARTATLLYYYPGLQRSVTR
jgi:MATE family multidrug resistance protein